MTTKRVKTCALEVRHVSDYIIWTI